MKEERILWKALCSPEQITADERMEQLEFKGYYWGYHALLFLVYVSALLIGQCHVWMESDAMRSFFSLIYKPAVFFTAVTTGFRNFRIPA